MESALPEVRLEGYQASIGVYKRKLVNPFS
jgi:hypothetical protein